MRINIFCLAAACIATAIVAQRCDAQSTSNAVPTYTVEQYANRGPSMMPIIMKVTLPADQMKKMADMMRAGYNGCFVEDLDPEDDSSMLMICGVRPSAGSFAP
jgi:hypothetical protein